MGQNVEELKAKVKTKRAELEAKLEKAIAETQGRAAGAKSEIKKKLAELDHHIKGGWENITEKTAAKINEWLK